MKKAILTILGLFLMILIIMLSRVWQEKQKEKPQIQSFAKLLTDSTEGVVDWGKDTISTIILIDTSMVYSDLRLVDEPTILTLARVNWRNARNRLIWDTLIYKEYDDGTRAYYFYHAPTDTVYYSGIVTYSGPKDLGVYPATLRDSLEKAKASIFKLINP